MRRVAFITGGSTGIGLELVRELVRQNFNVATCSSTSKIEAVAKEFQGHPQVLTKQVDVKNFFAMQTYIEEIENKWGPINVLVNNAAITGPFKKQVELKKKEIKDTAKTNYIAPRKLTNMLLPKMESNPSNIIINVSSNVATRGVRGGYPYSISKADLYHFTQNIAAEYPFIKIFSVDPGATKTNMLTTVISADPNIFPFRRVIENALKENKVKTAADAAKLIAFVILYPDYFNRQGDMISPEEIKIHMGKKEYSSEKMMVDINMPPLDNIEEISLKKNEGDDIEIDPFLQEAKKIPFPKINTNVKNTPLVLQLIKVKLKLDEVLQDLEKMKVSLVDNENKEIIISPQAIFGFNNDNKKSDNITSFDKVEKDQDSLELKNSLFSKQKISYS